jgi:hypothetical protein
MKMRWRIKDIIDLEYFFSRDQKTGAALGEQPLAVRDRNIYLKRIQPAGDTASSQSRSRMIRLWLEERRRAESGIEPEPVLPGSLFDEILHYLRYGFFFLGAAAGAGLTFSFLNYKGMEPLNVSMYLAGAVGLQILLLLILGAGMIIRTARGSLAPNSLLYALISGIVFRTVRKFSARMMEKLPVEKRDGFFSALGALKGSQRVYGSLFFWPVFILAQMLGIGFNIGVLSATILRVLGTDVAFGWQSTVQLSPEAVHHIVRIMAMPWSRFVRPEIAFPSLAQIEGSRIILKDGIYHLATPDLVSWWPFLCLAVLFYGLLPRLCLLGAGWIAAHQSLGRIDFRHTPCEQLLRRMGTPQIITRGSPVDGHPQPEADAAEGGFAPGFEIADRGAVVLIPDEIFDACPEHELQMVMKKNLNIHMIRRVRISGDRAPDIALIKDIYVNTSPESSPDVMMLQEAWQPPITETLVFIRNLREVLGGSVRIEVGLIGRPKPGSIFTPVKEQDWDTWGRKLKALGDPYLHIERLVKNDVS